MDISKRIRELRQEKEITVTELASAMGKSEGAVRMWETGKSKPDIDTIINLTKFFNVSSDFLLGISDTRKAENEKIIQEIGLSEYAIEQLKNFNTPSHEYKIGDNLKISDPLSAIIESKHFTAFLVTFTMTTFPMTPVSGYTNPKTGKIRTKDEAANLFVEIYENEKARAMVHTQLDRLIDDVRKTHSSK